MSNWLWNRRNVPQVNYRRGNESSDEDYNSPSVTPATEEDRIALWEDFRPDTNEVLEAAALALTPIADRRARQSVRGVGQPVEDEGLVVGEAPNDCVEAQQESGSVGSSVDHSPRICRTPPPVPIMVNYDAEDREDGEDYYKRVGLIKLEWDSDVQYWFNSI